MQKIMFNDRFMLTQAVLDGRKTQTRRIINPQPRYDERVGMVFKKKSRRTGEWEEWMSGTGTGSNEPQDSYKNFAFNCKHKVGEVLAVAMSYKDAGIDPYYKIYNERTKEYDNACDTAGWDNKMFVKAELMPRRIEITNKRFQQLHDITDEECIKEGIEEIGMADDPGYIYHDDPVYQSDGYDTPQEAYASLIDRISGKGTWDSNPYVFVYDFRLVK